MSKTYRDWSPDQSYMFPPAPKDWLPEDDLVYFILDTVATLDLTSIFTYYDRELRGPDQGTVAPGISCRRPMTPMW